MASCVPVSFWISLGLITALMCCSLSRCLGRRRPTPRPRISCTRWVARNSFRHGSEPSPHAPPPRCFHCSLPCLSAIFARGRFRGKAFLDAAIDILIVLPPMVVGLCLLILFQTRFAHRRKRRAVYLYRRRDRVRAIRHRCRSQSARCGGTFEHLSSRPEDVAMTSGCSYARAVWLVTPLPPRAGACLPPRASRGRAASASSGRFWFLPEPRA